MCPRGVVHQGGRVYQGSLRFSQRIPHFHGGSPIFHGGSPIFNDWVSIFQKMRDPRQKKRKKREYGQCVVGTHPNEMHSGNDSLVTELAEFSNHFDLYLYNTHQASM